VNGTAGGGPGGVVDLGGADVYSGSRFPTSRSQRRDISVSSFTWYDKSDKRD
jgi:hypothetical protein